MKITRCKKNSSRVDQGLYRTHAHPLKRANSLLSRLVLLLKRRLRVNLQCLALCEERILLLFEISVENRHLFPCLLPVFGVPVRVRALLAAGDLLPWRCARLFCEPKS